MLGGGARPLVVGVTGGVGTGKSTVLKLLGRLGAVTLSADDIAREVLAKETPGYRQTVERFGAGIVRPDGEIARAELARIIFADEQARKDLEAITHPRIIDRMREAIGGFRARPPSENAVLALEIPLLVECGLESMVDKVLVIASEQRRQLDRLTTGGQLSREEALARIDAQIPIECKIERADYVIRNDGTLEALQQSVERFYRRLGA